MQNRIVSVPLSRWKIVNVKYLFGVIYVNILVNAKYRKCKM